MKTIGFLMSKKENEKRRVLLPEDIKDINHKECLYFEEGYGEVLGISDQEYLDAGANIKSRDEIYNMDIVCDPKIGDDEELSKLPNNNAVFGWIHPFNNEKLVNLFLDKKTRVIAWEDMFKDNIHTFRFNNKLAGTAAVLNAFMVIGKLPTNLNVAVLGNGNTARGAIKALKQLEANVTIYKREDENKFKQEFQNYDVIVNCILWDKKRKDHIIYKDDLLKMKKNSLIIDVSCDPNGGIESCIATKIEDPIYTVNNVIHYCVDHTPSIYYKTFSEDCSKLITEFVNDLIEEKENTTITNATIINDGKILNKKVLGEE